MLIRIAYLILGIVTAIAMTASHGHASVSQRGRSLSAVAGVFVPGGAEPLNTGPLVGIKGGKSLTDIMEIEGDITAIQGGSGAPAFEFSLQFLYQLWQSPQWNSFLSFGAGGALVGSEGTSGFLLTFGLGGRYFLRQDLALRGELRQVIATESIGRNLELAMGVSYYFDNGEKKRTQPRLRPVEKPAPLPSPGAAPDLPKQAATLPAPVAVEPTPVPAPAPALVAAPVLVAVAAPEALEVPILQQGAVSQEVTPIKEAPVPVVAMVAAAVIEPPVSAPTLEEAVAEQVTQPAAKAAKPSRIVQTIKFETGSSFIAKKYYPKLAIIINAMKDNPAARATISGHADNEGTRASNLKLSALRADSVMYQLRKAGIAPTRLSRAAYGASQPLASNATKAGRQQNRRAVTVVTVEIK